MKKILTFIITFLLLIVKVNAFDITAKNVILYNLDTNQVIYSENENEKVSIASLTKIMAALVTLNEVDDLNKEVVITSNDLQGLKEANAVTAGFTLGEKVTYLDLLYGLLLPSGADSAQALAYNVSGSIDNFISKMNEEVKNLNLKNTHFSTVIGLDDENNYSTAKEISIIFKKALQNKTFKKIITTKTYTTSDNAITMHSSIQRNASKYNLDISYILGGKTGTTTDAGLCLATIANSNNINYMLITLGSTYDKKLPHHLIDSKTIYDYYIENYGNQKIVSKNKTFKTIKSKYTKKNTYKLKTTKNVYLYLPNNYNKKDVKLKYNGLKEVSSFTKENTKIGTLKIYYQNKLIDTQNIILKTKLKFNLLSFIKEWWYVLIILGVGYVIYKRNIKRKNKKHKR